MIEAQQILLSIAINAGVSVYVVARASDADRRRCCITEVHFEIVREAVIEPQCVPRFVLRNLALQEKISDVAGIEKIITCRRHELKQLLANRIDELGRDYVQVRIRSSVDRGSALRRLDQRTLKNLIDKNSSRIVELAKLICPG